MEDAIIIAVSLIKESVVSGVLMLVVMIGVGTFLNISFGEFRGAIIKCIGIVAGTSIVGHFLLTPTLFFFYIPTMFVMWFACIIGFFDIEASEAAIFTIIYNFSLYMLYIFGVLR